MNLSKHASLNLNVRGLGQSATIAINDRSRQLQAEGRNVYRLGLGQSPFPVPEPVVQALRNHAHEKDYLPAAGHRGLREAVAAFHRRKDGVEIQPDHVLIGPGSKELMFILQLVYYGELILPTPAWVSYVPQARIIGRQVKLIHTRPEDNFRMTAALMEKYLERENDRFRPRLLILNYPGNPEGCSYTCEELRALADVARKYEIILLSDEIYGQLDHRGAHCSVARYYPEGTIISSGLSKWCGAGGWRLGTFAFPPALNWLLETMTAVASETFTSVCAPIQCAAITAFEEHEELERYLCHCRRILAVLGNRTADILLAAGLQVPRPVGGFYLFLNFEPFREKLKTRGITDSSTLCEQLLQDSGVALLPGEVFGRACTELTTRLAYVDFDGAATIAASEAIPLDQTLPHDFAPVHCLRVIEAAERIAGWVA